MKCFGYIILFCLSLQFTLAQSEITGKVIDRETGEGIPFCNITSKTSSIGTASNELGEFIISIDSLPTQLIFSHIVYGQETVAVSQTSELTVTMSPLIASLDEVVVMGSKKDAYAEELVKNAFQKAHKALNDQKYGKAFYRQKSKNDEEYSEFSEIFYDISYTNAGITDWNIVEGRYALKEDAVHNRNYTALTRLLKPLQPNTDELIFPLHSGFEVYYEVEVMETIEATTSKIAVIHFKPLSSIKTPIFEGNVYIDTRTFDILKIRASLTRDDLELLKLNTNNGYWKNYTLSYEIVYKRDSTAVTLLDYIKVDQEFDYFKDDSLLYHTTSTSNLTFYEHYTPTSRKRLGGRMDENRSDWENLDEIGYNERFWANNPIVKRTPVEEEVISAFEKENAFSSIFLNSAENIALLTANLSEDPFIRQFTKSVNDYNDDHPVEKVFLHTDKDLFSSGEPVWFSAYSVIGPFHEFTVASRVLHVDLIAPNNKIVISQTLELLNGRSSGMLELPKNLVSGNYQLRAYTRWMRNSDSDFFFTKELKILNSAADIDRLVAEPDKIDLQFFPEGGHAVVGIGSKIAFKAVGSDGIYRTVNGKVLDSEGKAIVVLNTLDRGAGFFQLTPKSGMQYSAVLEDGTSYKFPEILESGYIISVNNLNEKSIKVIVQASPSLHEQSFYLIAHMRQRKYYQGKFEFGKNQIISFEIPKNSMPSGVLTLTLFDADKNPRCERAVFVNNREELVITAKIENQKLVKRSKVNMSLKVTDTYGRPVSADLSIAVTDMDQVEKEQNSDNILSYLLLQSELKGHIANSGQLFQDQKRSTLNQLDLVMLTHGWRKFPWQEVWKGQKATNDFTFEKGLVVSGIAKSKFGKPLPNTTLNVVAKSGDQLGMYTVTTQMGGKFKIPDFNFNGNTQLAIHAFDSKDNPLDVKVALDKNQPIEPPPTNFTSPVFRPIDNHTHYVDMANTRQRFNSLYDFDTINELEEVVVTDKKIEKSRNASPSVYGQTPDATVYADDHRAIQTVLQLVSLFPGVSVNGRVVSIRNQGAPLWVLNGIAVYNENPSAQATAVDNQRAARNTDNLSPALALSVEQSVAAGPVPSFIATMDTFTVERIEILKGASAAIYGSRGANGVILVYTKKGEGRPPIMSGDFSIEGHAASREFYSPKYDIPSERHEKPDYRATLYWNPSFTTDANGKADIEFFNSDTAKSMQIEIQGLTTSGIPGAYFATFGK